MGKFQIFNYVKDSHWSLAPENQSSLFCINECRKHPPLPESLRRCNLFPVKLAFIFLKVIFSQHNKKMIAGNLPVDKVVLVQHFQCRLADDYIMVIIQIMVSSADLGQRWAGRGYGSPVSSFGLLSPVNSSCLGRNASLHVGLATEHTGWAWRA